MRIVVIAPTPFFADRGSHIRILGEAIGLASRGHTITIVTYHIGGDPPISSVAAGTIIIKRIPPLLRSYTKTSAGPSWWKLILDAQLTIIAFCTARKHKDTLLYAHLHEGVCIGWIVQKLLWWKRIPLIVDFHGAFVDELKSHGYASWSLLEKILRRIERWIHRRGQQAICSSPEQYAIVAQDRDKTSIHHIPDGVLEIPHKSDALQMHCMKLLAMPAKKISLVVYTGSFLPNKGVDTLVAAMAIVRQQAPYVHFIFAGSPPQTFHALMKKYDQSRDAYTLIHPLPYAHVAALLAYCHIGVDPKQSDSNQASGKIVDYMAAGLPIICMDRPSNRALVGNGAYYTKNDSAQSLADAILTLVQDKALQQSLGSHNAQAAKNRHWITISQSIETCLIQTFSTHKQRQYLFTPQK